MTDSEEMLGNDWVLTVDFGPFNEEQLWDGGQPYALRLAAECTRWEHDCDSDPDDPSYTYPEGLTCPSIRKAYDYHGDLMWEVSEDLSTFTAYSDIIDALESVMVQVVMNTIPKKMTLESNRD